ncbi:MAG TPA: hypothetical protein VGP43_10470 [Chitinophagaceae bacterium]|nr:hypothetical protein [Chitinophagaceae bacterium]
MKTFLLITLALLYSFFAISQSSFTYTDREVHFDALREQTKLIAAPDAFIHLWKWMPTGGSVIIYDTNLKYQNIQKLPYRSEKISFIYLPNFYYALVTDSSTIKILYVGRGAKIIEKKLRIEKYLKSNGRELKDGYQYYFITSNDKVFLIQKSHDDILQKSLLDITAFDSNFNYKNNIAFEIEYIDGYPQDVNLLPFDNKLILVNKTITKDLRLLAVTKIDVENKTFFTKLFLPKDLEYISHRIVIDGNDLILQSQVQEVVSKRKVSELFSYFLKLDSNLEVKNDLYLNSNKVRINNPNYFYIPAFTLTLPHKEILFIDHGRNQNKISNGPKEIIRYAWIDSTFKILKAVVEPVNISENSLSILLSNGKKLQMYNQERISNKISLINSYDIKDGIAGAKPLQLRINDKYLFNQMILINSSSFVMPYVHNYNIGLVKVKIPAD